MNEEWEYKWDEAYFVWPYEGHLSDSTVKYNRNKDFTSLRCWQDCREVKLYYYKKVLPKLPPQEKYSLDTQIRKASISITANIAEGYGRFHHQEGIQFYRIARGSLYELKDHLLSCAGLGYVQQELVTEGTQLIETAKISLNGFIRYVRNYAKSQR